MQKIKILYITPTSKISGAETGLMYILDSLREDIEFVVICPKGVLVKELKQRGVKVIPLNMYNFMFKNPFLYFATIYKLFKIIIGEKPSIVHSNGEAVNQYVSIAAKLAKVPCLAQCHTVEFFSRFSALHLMLCDKILVNSRFTGERLSQFLPKSKIKVVYGGVDLNKFYPKSGASIRKKWGISNQTKVIGMLGMFLPRKGQEYFVEAARLVQKKIPNALFIFVGSSVFTDNKYENYIKEKAKEYNLNVLFTGFLDAASIIPIFDVFCMPSIDEAFGNVLNEVGAMEKPIVAFNSGGILEIIKNNYNGLLVEPKSSMKLAEKVISILEDKKLAKRLSLNARKVVLEKFDAKRYASDLIKAYKAVC